ncbi:hypothetical protein MSAN_02194600 [Mycena sanguinolenta]|uniref:Uncharacterized protein n=1 Tax=Mycena sanguinolenta TaxID=230812 RepID=A0A8H7CIA7_9AGAR|nr:hypothetical protein MSAN_02194600 [Mycena sanguinolenta]
MTTLPLELVENIWIVLLTIHALSKSALLCLGHGSLAADPTCSKTFCDLLRSPDCTFLPHVRSINNLKHYGSHDYAIYDKIPRDLAQLVSVRELEMTVMAPYVLEKLHTFLRTSFPRITRLILDLRNVNHPGSTLLANVICFFPALQGVVIRTIAVLEGIPVLVVPPRGLCSLSFCQNSVGQMLLWMEAAGQLSNVHTLTLPCLRGSDIPIVRKTLRQIGNQLNHLDLTLSGGLEGVETLQMIDLSLHQNLHTLRIQDLSRIHSNAQETILWIPRLIMQLRTPALERLTLALSLCWPPYEMFDWAALDAFLSPARFPCLRSVVIKCEYHGDKFFYTQGRKLDMHESVYKALPVLADSGVLRTEW